MGVSSSTRIEQTNTKHAHYIPESSSDYLLNSIVKIETNDKKIATGFFMKVNINNRKINLLLTCNHVITKNLISQKASIKILYGKKIKETTKIIDLDFNKRFIRSFEHPIDITLIEIIENDEIPEEKYLFPDLNYKNGYNFYKGKDIYLAGYPSSETNKGERCISSGEIKEIKNFEFSHSLDARKGSSGSPICLIDNKCVIGIHKQGDKIKPINYGTFIGWVLDELEKQITKEYDILSEYEKSDYKRCRKCGEIYQILQMICRQGDLKEVPSWWIQGRSNNLPKEDIELKVLTVPPEWDDGFLCVSHYDDKALEDIENGNCIMKNCDGKLDFIKFKIPTFHLFDN